MKNAIILHGRPPKEEYYSAEYPSASNSHWLPWLQKQLLMREIAAVTPEIPHSYAPDYDVWCREFERYDLSETTALVGHSCGGGFLVRWLSEHKNVKVGKVVLVAPWLDPRHRLGNDFFDFKIDPDLRLRTQGITIFSSDNDEEDIEVSVGMLTAVIPGILLWEMPNYGHFCFGDMHTNAFPELLDELLT